MLMYVEDMARTDLRSFAKMSQADLKGYAFAKIFPVIATSEKGGKIWVAPKGLTNARGTKNRTNGSALSATEKVTIEVSYSTDRIEGRSRIYENEMHGFADMNAACQAGAEDAGRKALNAMEYEAAGKVFSSVRTTAKVTLADHAVIKTLQVQAKAIRAFGKAFLYMSDAAFLKLCEIPEIRRKLELGAKVTGDIAYLALNDEKVLATVSTLLGFYGIAIFDSDIVGTTYDNYIAVVAVRPEAIGASSDAVRSLAKTRAMFGAMIVYIPEDAPADEPFEMSQSADKTEKCNLFDAEGSVVPKNFVDAVAKEGDATKMSENGGAVVCEFADSYTEYAVPVVNVTTEAAQ